MAAAGVTAVEAHDVVILILDPDASLEAAFAGFFLGGDVEHQAAHFAQEFAAHVIELVVLLIEAVGVNKNHLQKAVGEELHGEREEAADRSKNLSTSGAAIV